MGRMRRSRKRSMSRPVAGGRGQPGCGELEVGGSVAAEVGDEVGPAGGGVPGLDVGVAGEVEAEPVGEVGLGPGAGEAGGVVVQGEPVELEDPFGADRCGVGVVGAGDLGVDLPVGGGQRLGELAGAGGPGAGCALASALSGSTAASGGSVGSPGSSEGSSRLDGL